MDLPTAGLIPEIDRIQAQVAKTTVVDVKKELGDNVYPLIKMVAEMCGQVMLEQQERLEQCEIAIAEIASVGESVVLPDLAEQIEGVISLGLRVCEAIELIANEETEGDPEAVKAKAEAAKELTELVPMYREAAKELRVDIDEVTVELEEDDDPQQTNGKDQTK